MALNFCQCFDSRLDVYEFSKNTRNPWQMKYKIGFLSWSFKIYSTSQHVTLELTLRQNRRRCVSSYKSVSVTINVVGSWTASAFHVGAAAFPHVACIAVEAVCEPTTFIATETVYTMHEVSVAIELLENGARLLQPIFQSNTLFDTKMLLLLG